MSKRTRVDSRAERAICGAVLPWAGKTRRGVMRPTAGSIRSQARSAGGDRVLLPDGTWRRVETIRVRSLFG
ncbi:hypothetical protein [Streptomyces alanosinicus]|uniref:Uncharacterized protein n=1 Tax=Streptomyces alanosinicus TaxID=68171 RepID=A0A918YSD7_9ACTN|nr:hypothetical protein [Streptomyces alanosinicus]GHE13494.1 hypothetical protein GCM10010339_80640 [Streptomyces alanosinicus]